MADRALLTDRIERSASVLLGRLEIDANQVRTTYVAYSGINILLLQRPAEIKRTILFIKLYELHFYGAACLANTGVLKFYSCRLSFD